MNNIGLGLIKVKKSELLDALKQNRKQHRNIFLEAQEGFRTTFIKELDSMLADARSGKHFRFHVGLVQPEDHTKDYDRVIKMLEMSVDNEINLTQTEFQQYVMDDWNWKHQFIETTSYYNGNK